MASERRLKGFLAVLGVVTAFTVTLGDTVALHGQAMLLEGVDGFSHIQVSLGVKTPDMPFAAVPTEAAIERTIRLELSKQRVPFGLPMDSDSVVSAMIDIDVSLGQPILGVIVYAVQISARQWLRDRNRDLLVRMPASISMVPLSLGWAPVSEMPEAVLEEVRISVAVLVDLWHEYH